MTVAASAQPAEQDSEPRSAPVVSSPSAWWVLIAGAVGLVASVALTVEKIKIALNSSYVPSCNLNPVVSCGSVMTTPQAAVLGVPNPLIGIAAFTVVVVTGVLTVAKVALPQWYWMGLAVGTLAGVGLVHWLIFQSLYRIGALCPYCMAVWAVAVPLLVVVASIALRPALGGSVVARELYRYRWSIVTLWFTGVLLLILSRFWDYWSTLV
ncbi:vitamin K epoxide reductase family protein [Mycobacterium sp.]|uniref:vitamin K epoxide reductase family protein n=1 Tax=Mycobacterium sp. TaxID=1785 RepID=UPI0031DC75BF